MLKSLYRWPKGTVVTLVPNTGIQFLDFGISAGQASKAQQDFFCELCRSNQDAEGRFAELLHLVQFDEEGQPFHTAPETSRKVCLETDEIFSMRGDKALNALAGHWLPAPVLRIKEDGSYAEGPTNWARLFVTPLTEPDQDGNLWRITLAFDTLLAERPADGRYTMPEPRDAAEMAPFGLASVFEAVNPFMRLDWVKGWLRDCYLDVESARRGGRKVTLDDLPQAGIYWAAYYVLLQAVGGPDGPFLPRLRLLDETLYTRDLKPIPVNLVIDIGNSRTCGILIEEASEGGQRLDISQAYRLEMRDLSNPSQTYSNPFESRVEFHPTHFNRGAYSRKSGRPVRDAFWWPSPVRVGPEAAWLAALTDGTQGRSGLSSPKRYLWDRNERTTPWVNNGGLLAVGERVPPIRGPIPSLLTEKGELLKDSGIPGMKPSYSRSALYMLMVAEILAHALSQINAPSVRAYRPRSEEPRHLRRVILTVPSATPVAEQRALKLLARDAMRLLWQVMGWDSSHPLRKPPELKLDWDEATATHLVYLYNEIAQKMQTAPAEFFALARHGHRPAGGTPSLRVASMDMGGGTTDLMIIQHDVTDFDRTILPRQIFREGFRLAGDDIVKHVIEAEILPCLKRALADAGVADPDHLLAERFGGDREGMAQQERTLRALFVNQALRPAALTLLALCESAGRRADDHSLSFHLSDAFPADRQPRDAVLAYLEEPARRAGAHDFSVGSILIETRYSRLAATILGVVRPMLTDLCDVVRAYECDVLLLTGRPSRLPIIKDAIVGQAPVPPGRIVSMDSYAVGNWYPFHSPNGRIDDPKTTAAVGAMLCQVCEGQVEGLLVRTSELRMRSTARHIGIMERNDQIRTQKLLYNNIDLDSGTSPRGLSVAVTPPAFIGYRQLPLDRWKTTPLYFLDFRDLRRVPSLQMPLTVVLERREPRDDDDESAVEDFILQDARDAAGENVLRDLRLSFQTLRVERDQEAGYWLDSGVLNANWQG